MTLLITNKIIKERRILYKQYFYLKLARLNKRVIYSSNITASRLDKESDIH